MCRGLLVRGASALLVVAILIAGRWAGAATTFSDFLVQAPKLAPSERGSVAGAFAHLAFEPGSLARGDMSLPLPIALPTDRGALQAQVLPSYSPSAAQSEWGMGWRVDLGIRRFAVVGDIDLAGDEFVSPWGRLARADDGRYLPLGAAPAVSLRRVDGGWVAISSDGTRFTFAAADQVAGGYAWMLTRVDSVVGDVTTITYERNASGRPFVTGVEWGGRGSQRQYRLELGYESISVALDDYRSGAQLSLDRRVRDVTVKVRAPAGTFDLRWQYRLDYTPSPRGAAFYLTGVTRTFGSGESEPTQRFEYEFGDTTIATAVMRDVPALDPVLTSLGGASLQPDKSTMLDVEDDGMVDFEVANDNTLVRQQRGGFTIEPLPADPRALALCRPSTLSVNPPRALARMTPDAPLQVFKAVNNVARGTTRVLVCDRQGVALSDQTISGLWALSQTIHLVDLNHDHRPDLIRLFSRGYQVVENTSDATGHHFVVRATGTLNDPFTPDSSWVQDMNGDGQPDLVMRSSSSLAVWYGLGQFRFSPVTRAFAFKTSSGTSVLDLAERQLTFIDVNRDGLMDVLTTKGRLLALFINNGRELREVPVPGLASMTWDFGVPVVADVAGSGDLEVLFVQGTRARSLRLSTPATGLLVAADDGKGTRVQFTYKRSAPAAGLGFRMSVLDTVTVSSSGYDPVTYRYDYGAPVVHSRGKHLVGFASVDKRAPALTGHVEFFNDDDVAGIHALSEDVDDRTPGIVRFTQDHYDDVTFHGVRWLRPASIETGHRSSDGAIRLATTTQYTVYERGFCPTVRVTSSPSGQLLTTTTLASVAALTDDAHCLAASQMLFGAHADPARDFTYLVDIARNDVGQAIRVTQMDLAGHALVLQDVGYTTEHRVASVSAPGRGTTVLGYDAMGRLASVTDPVGVVTQVSAIDPVTDGLRALLTVRPGASSTAFFDYDRRERLRALWDDVTGASQNQPLITYAYQDATSTAPARIDTQSLVDAITGTSRNTIDLVAADGESMVGGAWLGDHFALGSATIVTRSTLTARQSFIGVLTGQAVAAMTSADLRARGTPLVEAVHAGFGHATQTMTTQQDGVVGTVTGELALAASELVSRVHEPGGFTAESAVDAAGQLVRKTDENGVIHRYQYDALGRLVRVDTPDGAHTVRFDGFGRPAQVTRDAVGTITYAYDPVTGLLAQKQRLDAAGAITDTSQIRYDALGRPTQSSRTGGTAGENPGASDLAFDYDGQIDGMTAGGQLGRLTRVRGDGWARSTLFDPLGRAYYQHVALTGWRNVTTDTTHRADGSIASTTTTITDPIGGEVFASTKETELDSLGRVATLKVDGAVLYTLAYDPEGRLARADFASGEAITFDFDPTTHARRGHDIAAPAASGGVRWNRDPRGLVANEIYTHGAAVTRRTYDYDGRGALTRSTSADEVASYTYTASGLPDTIIDTLGTRTVRHAAGSQIIGDTVYTWDAAGRVAGKGDWTFDYGAHGQLARARRAGRQIDFVYDDADQRLLKRVDGAPVRADVAGGVLTEGHFVELVVIGDVVAGVLDNGKFTALLTDPRGTPFSGPDGTAGMATPYGVRASHLGYADVIDYARLGWDPDLDIVRMGVRDYDTRLGQFLTPDPLYFEDLQRCTESSAQCSLYGYAGGNPISFVDPNGMEFSDVLNSIENVAVAAANFAAEKVVPRVIGAAQAAGGALLVGGSAALCTGTAGAGCALGVLGVAYGTDLATAGVKQVITGRSTSTLSNKVLAKVTNQQVADSAELAINAGILIGGIANVALRNPFVKRLISSDAAGVARGSCFVAGTVVHGLSGLVAIEKVRIGDWVWSRDELTGRSELRQVLRTFVTPDQPIWLVILTDSEGRAEALEVTGEHPFHTSRRGWVQVHDLLPGDSIDSIAGAIVRVVEAWQTARRAEVYNIEVQGLHTYFVGKSGSWVHNNPCARVLGRLKSLAPNTWESSGGLVYGPDKNFGNRVQHVLAHTVADATKPAHSVFNVGRGEVLGLIDEAWMMRSAHVPGDPGAFVVSMGRQVGTAANETAVRIVVRPGTNQIITAYPVVP